MKKIGLFIAIATLLLSPRLHSQILFEKQYGLNTDNLDQAGGAVLASDGGLVLAGYTELAQDYEIFIQKLKPDGSELWYKTLDHPGLDIASGIIAAAGGGYFISGLTLNPDNGSFDALLLKVDENGALLWRKTFGAAATDGALALCQISNGNIILLGATLLADNTPAHFRAVFNPAGTLISAANYPAAEDVSDIKAVPTSDGGYLAYIESGSFFSSEEIQIAKYDAGLNQQWAAPLTILNILAGAPISRLLDLDATAFGILLCVRTDAGVQLLHLANNNAALLWNRRMQSSFTNGVGIQPYPNGTIGLASYSVPFFYKKLSPNGLTTDSIAAPNLPLLSSSTPQFVFDADQQLYLFSNKNNLFSSTYTIDRLNLSGAISLAWNQSFGSASGYEDETGDAIASTPDGGFVLVGTKPDSTGIYLEPPASGELLSSLFRYRTSVSTLDANGSLLLDLGFGNDATHPISRNADCTPDGNIIFCGTINYGLNTQDAWVVKTAGKMVGTALGAQTEFGTLSLSPNPANEQTRFLLESPYTGPVQVQVIDQQGRVLANANGEKRAEQWSLDFSVGDWPAGQYQLVVRTEQGQGGQKMIVVR